ncbi:MAG: hypothetical protein DRJ44_04595 [Thermoprotei archaeon]|nr:MAG: hypothetical protein DRJ44_04595 [Thermoprotei archaeon]
MEDEEIEMLIRQKMLEMQKELLKKNKAGKTEKKDPWSIIKPYLTTDGMEMLLKAKAQYPKVASVIVKELARLIQLGKMREKLNAEDIYGIFFYLGYPIRVETKIVIKRKGKVKSISDLLREDHD